MIFPAYQVVVMPECFTKTIPVDGLEKTDSTMGAQFPWHVKFKELTGKNETGEQEIIKQSIKKTYGYFLLSLKDNEKKETDMTSFTFCLYSQLTLKV